MQFIFSRVNQRFSDLSVLLSHLEGLVLHRLPGLTCKESASVGLGLGPRMSNKFPGAAAASDLGATLCKPLL